MEICLWHVWSIEFFWPGALATFLLAILMRFFSKLEGTYDGNLVNLTYVRHWGIRVGDVIIMPFITGIIIPVLIDLAQGVTVSFIVALIAVTIETSIIITCACHFYFWRPKNKESNGLILNGFLSFPHLTPLTGWAHFVFMTIHLALILLFILVFIFEPMPKQVIIGMWLLMSIFLPVSTLQPRMMENQFCHNSLLDRHVVRDFCLELLGIAAVCLLKLI